MQAETLSGGFQSPAVEAAHAFRAVMEAMARPGTMCDIRGATPPAPLSVAAGSVLLTLCDSDTPVYLAGAVDTPDIRAWLAFHTGAPLTGPAHCVFAVGAWDDLQPLSAYPIGTSEYPDRSATLIVECENLAATGATLKGPGIKTEAHLPLPDPVAFQANRALYPLGLDFILTSESKVAALPRSAEVVASDTAMEVS